MSGLPVKGRSYEADRLSDLAFFPETVPFYTVVEQVLEESE